MSDESVIIPKITKHGMYVSVSGEMIRDDLYQRFPRRHHTIEHPITPEIQAEYDGYVQQFISLEDARAKLHAIGERRDWSRSDGGYEWEPAELVPLRPRVEVVYDETSDEHHKRVRAIWDHHKATGEWLEEPQQTFMELMESQMIRAMSFGFDSKA